MAKAKVNKSSKRKAIERYRSVPSKIIIGVAARQTERLELMRRDHEVLKFIQKGNDFHAVAEKFKMDEREALKFTKDAIQKWCVEIALTAEESRHVHVRQLDVLIKRLDADMEPKPMYRKGKPVFDPDTGDAVMEPVNLDLVRTYLSVTAQRNKILGLNPDAPAIQVNSQVNVVERVYRGASPDDL